MWKPFAEELLLDYAALVVDMVAVCIVILGIDIHNPSIKCDFPYQLEDKGKEDDYR